jgi:hypothetical protein
VLFAATTSADLAVLMSLEIPATLTSGLADLAGDYLQQVQEAFQLYPPKPNPQKGIIHENGDENEKASSTEFVGEIWLGKVAERVK